MEGYKEIAKQARIKTLELIFKAGTSHIGSCFSAIDIMAILFEKADREKDEVILSAGWKAAAWYYFLWKNGVITEEELNSFCQPESKFIGLIEPMGRWGLKSAGGSMCMGLAFGVGFALAKKLKEEKGKIYVLESDGGMQGGITWEALALAAHHKLNNLVLIIDKNSFQAMGKTEDILDMDSLDEKLKAFGWEVRNVDGHNFEKLESCLTYPPLYPETPLAIIAHTIKGKGVSFMENENLYHYKNLSEEEYNLALKELNL